MFSFKVDINNRSVTLSTCSLTGILDDDDDSDDDDDDVISCLRPILFLTAVKN